MIDHLLLECVLARQVWAVIMDNWEKPHWTPEPEAELVGWWTSLNIQKNKRKETWTVVTLVAWTLWKHRNDIVFNGASPSVNEVLRRSKQRDKTGGLRHCCGRQDRSQSG